MVSWRAGIRLSEHGVSAGSHCCASRGSGSGPAPRPAPMTPRHPPKGRGSELVESPWCADCLRRRAPAALGRERGVGGEGWQRRRMLRPGVLPAGRWGRQEKAVVLAALRWRGGLALRLLR